MTSGAVPLAVQFADQSQVDGAYAWYWEFGDGQTSTLRNPSHSYAAAGTYNVRLTVTGTGGAMFAQKLGFITGVPSSADFTADVTSGPVPLTVQFTDRSQVAGAYAWYWEFGDGQTSTLQNPGHTYTSEGSYTVRLTVTGTGGPHVAEKPAYIRVGLATRVAFIAENEPLNAADSQIVAHLEAMGLQVDVYDDERTKRPTAAEIAGTHALVIASSTILSNQVEGDFRNIAVPFIYWEPSLSQNGREALANNPSTIGSQTQINVLNSSHPIMAGVSLNAGKATVASSAATFGRCSGPIAPGVEVLATQANSTTYRMVMVAEPGAVLLDGGTAAGRRVQLFLYDTTWTQTTADGKRIFDNAVAYCLGPVNAEFVADKVSGTMPMTVQFTDQSTGPVVSWAWDFGDGGSSSSRNPSHVYARAGQYTVSLTVTGFGSSSSTRTRTNYITIASAPGDFDHDGDVDLGDFSFFQICFNGPNRPPVVVSACPDTDFDKDGDVDLSDFSTFQACFNGPNRPASCAS